MKRKQPAPPPIAWTRADPQALAGFDPATKICTMNCGPAVGDPRSKEERKFLCDECMPAPERKRDGWIERWYGSGPDRGWWIWEADHGDRVAYCGEGEFAERLCSLIVQKHNDAVGVPGTDGGQS